MKYANWLSHMRKIGARTADKLLCAGLDAQEIYHSTNDKLRRFGILTEAQLSQLDEGRAHFDLDKEYEKLAEKGICYLSRESPGYPEKLKELPDPPYGIYYRGALPEKDAPTVAVVGSRNCSTYGSVTAYSIGKALAARGVNIVSGLARGVDAQSQKGALDASGKTIGVLGSGVDVCYPPENLPLYNRMQRQGGVVSEFPPGEKPRAYHFPLRNRVISGLSDAIIVVEARAKSGSLITADLALEQGKEVFVVPGQIDSSLSNGCNSLLRQGAGVFLDVDNFIADMAHLPHFSNLKTTGTESVKFEQNPKKATTNKKFDLVNSEVVVYSEVNLLPKGIEEIRLNTGLDLPELMCALLSLQEKGLIVEVGTSRYVRGSILL